LQIGGWGQEAASEQGMVLGLDGAALAGALDPLGATAARPVQRQPMTARLQPLLDRARLRGVGVGPSDIGDQQAADREPFFDIGEVVGDRSRHVLVAQDFQQPQTRIIVVVPGHRAGRKAAGNQMRAAVLCLCHRDHPLSPFDACKSSAAPVSHLPLLFAMCEISPIVRHSIAP